MTDQQNTKDNSCHTPRTKAAGDGSTPSEITAVGANVGSAGQFWSRRRCGRQGRARSAPPRGQRALTALRHREIGLPSCRGSLSITRSDVSDLASPDQSASACLCKTLQNASNCFKSPMQNHAISCKKLLRMLRNVSFCCVHTCASVDDAHMARTILTLRHLVDAVICPAS